MRRAIGIVRVSEVGDRDGESFASPDIQAERIRAVAGLNVTRIHEELDVSGGKPLAKRDGLRQAVEAIERGEADVLVAAYFDRLFRSLKVQAEVVERVERAGGRVMALDIGRVSSDSAAEWLSGTMLGAVSEYYRRSTGERTKAAGARAVARGVPIIPRVPVGYRRADDGRLEPDPQSHDLPAKLFQARLDGVSWLDLQRQLADRGYPYTLTGIRKLLQNRLYLGEINHGDMHNPRAHKPLVERDVFERVQRSRQQAGPPPKSNLLLARLGVLRCSCGRTMSANGGSRTKPAYHCQERSPGHMMITAATVNRYALEAAWLIVADAKGVAAARSDSLKAINAAKQAQTELDDAIGALTAAGLATEPASIKRLTELREKRDAANRAADAAREPSTDILIDAPTLREHATRDESRALIRATIDRILVSPPRVRGSKVRPIAERLEIWPRGAVEPLDMDALRDLVEN